MHRRVVVQRKRWYKMLTLMELGLVRRGWLCAQPGLVLIRVLPTSD